MQRDGQSGDVLLTRLEARDIVGMKKRTQNFIAAMYPRFHHSTKLVDGTRAVDARTTCRRHRLIMDFWQLYDFSIVIINIKIIRQLIRRQWRLGILPVHEWLKRFVCHGFEQSVAAESPDVIFLRMCQLGDLVFVERREKCFRRRFRYDETRRPEAVHLKLDVLLYCDVVQDFACLLWKHLVAVIDEIVAVHARPPRDARFGLDFEMLQRNLPFLAHPSRWRRELFKIGDGFDGAFLHLGTVLRKIIVHFQLHAADLEQLVQRFIEFGPFLFDIRCDFHAKRLLRVGNAFFIRIERLAIIIEQFVKRSRIRDFP